MRIAPLPLTALLTLTALLMGARTSGVPQSTSAPEAPVPPEGRLTRLYAADPVICALDLRSGAPGMVVIDGEVFNRESHLAMGFAPDSLAVGVQGRDEGTIVDLGSLREVAIELGRPVQGNGGNAYAAIDADWARPRLEALPMQSIATARIQVGHVYLMRVTDGSDRDLLAKLLVLEHQPSASVTLRWKRLQ